MGTNIKPVVYCVNENPGFLSNLKTKVKTDVSDSDILLEYPTVYVHNWIKTSANPNGLYDVYIGESNDVIERTKEHYQASTDPNNWQYHLTNDGDTPKMYIIGHKHFNKSLTLDIENRLIHYISSMKNVDVVHNGRGNPQNEYYPSDEFEDIFHMIWSKLRKLDKNLFLSESEIKDSAIFKASPLHKLTKEQIDAKHLIIDRVVNAINNNLTGQLIFVNGEAGTGKTVLNSSTFYELLDQGETPYTRDLECCLMVNHDEQVSVYQEIAQRLKLTSKFGNDIVTKPTSFINHHSSENMVDVAFVDEAHLLLTQGKQSYRGSNQLKDILERARVTIVMFDENQVLTTEEFWEDDILQEFIDLAKSQGNYITLTNQLRMNCAETTKTWIDDLTKNHVINPFVKDSTGYEVKIFDTPKLLHEAIKKKANDKNTKLSRVVASYDWEYSSNHEPEGKKYWNVKIGSWSLPWNRELQKDMSAKEKRKIKNLAWAEQPQTINECGSTFTIQGFDLSYAGVIIGPSVKFENGKVIFKPKLSKNEKAIRNRTLSDGTVKKFGEQLLQNELRVLLTRGVKGLYIYACDDELRKELKKVLNNA